MRVARSVCTAIPRARGSFKASLVSARCYSTQTIAARYPVTALNEEEEMIKSTVHKFSKERIAPKVREMDEKAKMDPQILKECFENGFMGIEIPADVIAIEELAKIDPAVSVMVDVQNTLVNTAIRKWGTEAQRQAYLPRLAKDTLGSFCLSEWGSGSDAFALKTKAEKKGDYYILNGTKAWITNANEAGIFLVLANVDFSLGYRGITAFIVDRNTEGIQIGKKEDKLGIRASSTCEVNLVNCKVPAVNVLGEVGKGYKIAIESLNEGRVGIAAQMIGLAQGALDATVPYLHAFRQQFGKPIAEFQGMQFTIAECATEIMTGRLSFLNAARAKEANLPFVVEASIAKLHCSQVAERVASKCVNMLGGVGFTKEFPVEKFFRDCKVGQIYEGTTNIQLQTIAKNVLSSYSS